MKEIILATVWVLFALSMIGAMFMLFRVQWVFSQRMRLIDHKLEDYLRLEPFNVMVRKFWIWDVNQFMATPIKYPETYVISEGGKSITCKRCKRTSYNLNDVAEKYCGHCHIHHGDIYPPLREAWLKY